MQSCRHRWSPPFWQHFPHPLNRPPKWVKQCVRCGLIRAAE